MKKNKTLLVVGWLSVVPLAFGQSTNSPSSVSLNSSTNSVGSASATKTQSHQPYTIEYKLEKKGAQTRQTDKIERLGKDSSQAWTTIAGQQQNLSVYQDCSTHKPRFDLWSWGQEPWW